MAPEDRPEAPAGRRLARATLETGIQFLVFVALGALVLLVGCLGGAGPEALGRVGIGAAVLGGLWWLILERQGVRALLRRVEPAPAGSNLEPALESLRRNLGVLGVGLLLFGAVVVVLLILGDANDAASIAGAPLGLAIAKAAAVMRLSAWQRRNRALLVHYAGRRPGVGSTRVSYAIPTSPNR